MSAYIIQGLRSPVAKGKRGGFKNMRSDDIAVSVIKQLVEKVPSLDTSLVDDIIVGNSFPEAEQGMQMARMIGLMSIGVEVPGVIVNRFCGSGLEAIAIATAKINAGMADCIIAGGTESMSMGSMTGIKPAMNWKISKENPDYYIGMGLTAEEVAKEYSISREDMDTFSYNSHKKALNAIENGYFSEQIAPVKVKETIFENTSIKEKENIVSIDEGPRKGTSVEVLGKLRPAFSMNGTVTAGNSSQVSDGAAFVLVMSEKIMKQLNLEPQGRLLSYAVAGVEPKVMGIGPVKAVPKALKYAGIKQKDIEQTELNEAFAAQALAVIKDLDIEPDTVNVNGGAIALGHPLGCTGAKLSIQLLSEMKRRKQKYGLVTACVGGGQGVAGIFERI